MHWKPYEYHKVSGQIIIIDFRRDSIQFLLLLLLGGAKTLTRYLM